MAIGTVMAFAGLYEKDEYAKKIYAKMISMVKKSQGADNPSLPNPAAGNQSSLGSDKVHEGTMLASTERDSRKGSHESSTGPNLLLHQHVKQGRQEPQKQLLQAQLVKQQKQQHEMLTQQQLNQQKQMQATQMPAQQLPQLHQMSNIRQGSGIKPGLHQQHHPGGQHYCRLLKSGASLSISSSQSLQASHPQLSKHSSPQIEWQCIFSSHQKVGTSLQYANSPLVVASPFSPVAASPIPGDPKKLCGISTTTNLVNLGHQPQTQALVIDTPGISASPFLAEFVGPDGSQANASTTFPSKSSTTEVKSVPFKFLRSSIRDIRPVVKMVDNIAGSTPFKDSKYSPGEDLVATIKSYLNARNILSQDVSIATKRKLRRCISTMPLSSESAAGSVSDLDTSEFESRSTSNANRQRVEANLHALLEEIKMINRILIDTVVSFSDDEDLDSVTDPVGAVEGTAVKFSFSAASLGPNLKSHLSSVQMSPIVPLRLLVPADYPKSSPILFDELPTEPSKEYDDLSVKAQLAFSRSVCHLMQPMSLLEMARTWDSCVRKVIGEYAQQKGGGSFSLRYGTWENCANA